VLLSTTWVDIEMYCNQIYKKSSPSREPASLLPGTHPIMSDSEERTITLNNGLRYHLKSLLEQDTNVPYTLKAYLAIAKQVKDFSFIGYHIYKIDDNGVYLHDDSYRIFLPW